MKFSNPVRTTPENLFFSDQAVNTYVGSTSKHMQYYEFDKWEIFLFEIPQPNGAVAICGLVGMTCNKRVCGHGLVQTNQ